MAVKTVHHIKYKNIAIALAILLLIILAISSACSDKVPKTKEPSSSVSQKDSSSIVDKNKLTNNFKYVSIKNEEAIKKGVLTLIDSNNKYSGGVPADLDGVYSYLFNKSDDQIMSTSSTDVKGSQALLESLNSMMSDFYSKTKLTNVIVNTIYYSADSADAEKSDNETASVTLDSKEHETGYAFDLNTYSADTGAYPEFTGEGKYKWIVDNCYKYGIVQRYTKAKAGITGVKEKLNHFRYVGKPNAEIMVKNDLCLEEYLDFIKKYSFEKPFVFESDEMITYAVYYVAADKGKTTNIPIPLKENDTEYNYAYSGNNIDGYIMWVVTEDNSKLLKAESSTAEKSDANSSTASSKTEDSQTSESKSDTDSNVAESKPDSVESVESKASTSESKKTTDAKETAKNDSSKKADDKKTSETADSSKSDKTKDKSSKSESSDGSR